MQLNTVHSAMKGVGSEVKDSSLGSTYYGSGILHDAVVTEVHQGDMVPALRKLILVNTNSLLLNLSSLPG